MTLIPNKTESVQQIAINWTDRWQAYYRLKELEVPCQCGANQPLQVQISNPITAIQVWSVVKHFTASRSELVMFLTDCWKNNDIEESY